MNYQQTLQYMFERLPMFQRQGASAFKKDLGNITKLCNYLNNPQNLPYDFYGKKVWMLMNIELWFRQFFKNTGIV